MVRSIKVAENQLDVESLETFYAEAGIDDQLSATFISLPDAQSNEVGNSPNHFLLLNFIGVACEWWKLFGEDLLPNHNMVAPKWMKYFRNTA